MEEKEEEVDQYLETLRKISKVVHSTHEPQAPVGSDEAAITGQITVDTMYKLANLLENGVVADTLGEKLAEEYRVTQDSYILDVGSGMGFPVLSFACLYVSGVIGIELSSLITAASCQILRQFSDTIVSPLFLYRGNFFDVTRFDHLTHMYTFSVGMPPALIEHICAVAARTLSLKVLVLSEKGQGRLLLDMGVALSSDRSHPEDKDIVSIPFVLAGSHRNTFSGYVIPMTPARRWRMLDTCKLFDSPRPPISLEQEALSVFSYSEDWYRRYYLADFNANMLFSKTRPDPSQYEHNATLVSIFSSEGYFNKSRSGRR